MGFVDLDGFLSFNKAVTQGCSKTTRTETMNRAHIDCLLFQSTIYILL